MRRLTALTALVIFGIFGLAGTASAATKDYAATALNILPSGQYGVPAPGADAQALMYDGLTPLFNKVQNSDLTKYFKSEAIGTVGNAGPGVPEVVPRAGVTITRDKYGVPHVKSTTYDGGIWAAGWIAAKDRGLLLSVARYNSRVAAIDVPHLSAIGLVASVADFKPSAETETALAKQTDALLAEGKEGKAVLRDIDTYISGINAYLAANDPDEPVWTRNDVYAVNALKDQFLGEGGGDEARRSQFLGGLIKRLGAKKGWKVFNDLRQHTSDRSPTSIDGNFPYEPLPKKSRKGSVVLDPDSFVKTSVTGEQLSAKLTAPKARETASNTLMVTKEKSATGKPLMVGGPQISYFFPGLVYEIDMDAPGLKWRGATTAPFPGYLLIGRGQDFATTLTSASGDVVDQYAEQLCGGSDTKYLYKGKCRTMGTFNAGTLDGDPVSFKTTVHGPVVGYATVKGRKVALASKRSSYGKDVVDLLFNRRISNGTVKSPSTFFKAAAQTPQTFNSFYIDDRNVAEYTSGLLPMRHPKVDPGLPTKGTGKFEWKGFLKDSAHPHGKNPKSGLMVNWNNSVAHKFGSADDQWGRAGTVARVNMLNKLIKKNKRNGKWTMASLVSAMNAAATQDVRSVVTTPLLAQLLKGSKAPNAMAAGMLEQMVAWNKKGSSRLDRNLDGLIDAPGAASMDGAWGQLTASFLDPDATEPDTVISGGIADAFMKPKLGSQLDELNTLFSRFDLPPSGQYAGWYQYFERDIKKLLGKKTDPFRVSYCGHGNKGKCQKAIWGAISDAGEVLAQKYGSDDPSTWRADANRERIRFSPLPMITMRYTNRPSGIQQVISFKGHR